MSKDDAFPISVRFNFNQLTKLGLNRGALSRSDYIRWCSTGQETPLPRIKNKFPVKDHQALAQLLAKLSDGSLSSNVNQLAKGANLGTLECNSETEKKLFLANGRAQAARISGPFEASIEALKALWSLG